MTLQARFLGAAAAHGPRIAVEDLGGRAITYAALHGVSDRVRDRLVALGVRPGDRVGLCLRKTIDAVAALIGVMKCGAAYVPVDATASMTRAAYILGNCQVAATVVEEDLAPALADLSGPKIVLRRQEEGPLRLERALDALDAEGVASPAQTVLGAPKDLAYVLYTSGSTGQPKGVVLTQENALAFVDWCVATLAPTAADRFSSHAPFHFDLSILDLYTPWHAGSALVLLDEKCAKDAAALADVAASRRITVWYSTPSVLSMMAQAGRMERHDYAALRLVCFAGEVFPLVHLRSLVAKLPPHVRYLNLYGPTETNVCTYYEVPRPIPEDRKDPFPIGEACAHFRARVVGEDGRDVPRGDKGELVMQGPAVTQGYWALPEVTARAFLVDESGAWYRTGDIVLEEPGGGYVYAGRRDRMVKRRGYRVELGEIEACLYGFPGVEEAAVIAEPDADAGVRIRAFLCMADRGKPSIIALKQHCSSRIPVYMVPDTFAFLDGLPHTSTDKIDYQQLRTLGPAK